MLYYTTTGDAPGPPLLFLHAGNYSGPMWHDIAARLTGMRCIFVDLPGHGYSREIQLTSLEQAADAVAMVIERGFESGPVNLVGLSFGGYVGLTLMIRHPHLIRRAMISGIHLGSIPNARAMNAFATVMSPLIQLRWVRRRLAEPLGITDPAIINRTDGRPNLTPRTMRAVLRLVSVFDVHDALPSISVPTLVIAGGNEHATIVNSLDDFQDAMQNCTARTVPGMGHAWCNEDPRLFAQTAQAWCDEEPLPSQLDFVEANDI
ncbi:alpha/beta fold hydrolase [Phaeobacter inhibens]|uniref:alpha/beta fold hydrolase n=1 Tax=Phaeobacter inhibens TaxID=221822 RepID=UPI0021A70B00|nr:alpha/beta hydrolase [Phaeobacter inhibens]UWR47025.1 alpha/beta hydrolase [Phaeobacter inhibens]UWR90481.1 alpha/beta hydrolase [Phaeobacter inhibens]